MHKRKLWNNKKIYPTYEPYPISRDFEGQAYSTKDASHGQSIDSIKEQAPEELSLISDPSPSGDWFPPRPITPDEQSSLRPLHLLNSLFTERLNFLQCALEELRDAQHDRERLTDKAFEELDSEIQECEHSLSLTLLIDPEQKRHLQRRLLELKRERRREALLSWRDLVWLRGEIRKLQREIDTLGRTAKSTKNRKAPT